MRFGTDKLILGHRHVRKRGGDVNLPSQGLRRFWNLHSQHWEVQKNSKQVLFYKYLRCMRITLVDEE